MSSLELKVPPPVVAAAFAAAMWGVSVAWPTASFELADAKLLGIFLASLGLLVAAAGILAFRAHHTTVNPRRPAATSTVVTTGIFARTRNPMYLGLALVLLGWSVFLRHPASMLVVGAFIAYITEFQIKPEERVLAAKFGEPFARYKAAVRRWL